MTSCTSRVLFAAPQHRQFAITHWLLQLAKYVLGTEQQVQIMTWAINVKYTAFKSEHILQYSQTKVKLHTLHYTMYL